MGGARAGEVASRMALEEFGPEWGDGASWEERLERIAGAATRRIYERAQEDDSRAGMGTTLTAVEMTGDAVSVAHVGDSRLYLLRDGSFERLTTDHSLVEEYVRAGKLTPEQAENHPQKSIITRALGPEPDVDVETFTCPAREGDRYLLCSDGLTSMVSEREVQRVFEGAATLEHAARALVDRANENGGRDNITVVLFRLGDGEGTGDADSDTLSGAEGADLGRRVRERLGRERGEGPAPAGTNGHGAAHGADDTVAIDRETAARARAEHAAGASAETSPASGAGLADAPPDATIAGGSKDELRRERERMRTARTGARRGPGRTVLKWLAGVVALAALLVAGWIGL